MATRKTSKGSRRKRAKSLTISIDLATLDKLYKKRYVVTLDGGDTKVGTVRDGDGGDTKSGVLIRDGDTKKGGPVRRKSALRKRRTPTKKKT